MPKGKVSGAHMSVRKQFKRCPYASRVSGLLAGCVSFVRNTADEDATYKERLKQLLNI